MLETSGWFRGEGFGPIVDDLLRLAGSGGGVIAEDALVGRVADAFGL